MADETPIKKPRGNPNFIKRKQDNNTTNNMADEEKNEKPEVKTQPEEGATPPPPTDTLPADLFSDKIPTAEVLPLDGQVKEKAYAALPSDATTTSETPSTPGSPPSPTDSMASSTPAATVAPPKTLEEINSQAAQTVDLMLKGYEKAHQLGRYLGKVDESNLAQMHAKGEIDLQKELPLGKKTVTVGQFFDEYNQGVDQNIVVDQDFKDKIRPPLTRICIKNNWLLNDEMYVLTMLAEDVTTKVSLLIGMKKACNLVLDACQQMMKSQKEHGNKKAPPRMDQQPQDETVDWHEPDAAADTPQG